MAGHVVIEIKAFGINHAEMHMRRGEWAEAAAFAVPDRVYGEEIHAAVVPQAEVTAAALQAYCRSRLADFKVPKVIHFIKELPKGSTGKVERLHLTELFLK